MTREEKLKILRTTAVTPDMHPDDFGKWNEALRSAIEALSEDPCEDAISRVWLKEAIHNFYYGLKHTPTEEDIQAYIDAAPTVTPRQKMCFDGMTNGEVIKTLFPSCKTRRENTSMDNFMEFTLDGLVGYAIEKSWWDAPYKAERGTENET